MMNSADPDQLASSGRVYPGSAGPGLKVNRVYAENGINSLKLNYIYSN